MDASSQIWKPLNPARREIRLFILAPSINEKAVLRGRLITRSSDEQLYYEAISHAWGRPSFPEVVVIDGIEWVVSTGVFEALQRLRHANEEKVFWIDALCIDQSNLKERGEQVKLMHFIFNRAVNVQVWLGRTPTTISRLVTDMHSPTRLENLFSTEKLTHINQIDFNILSDFVRLDYWSRTWVWQEMTLARSVRFVFGPRTFTFDRLKALYDQLELAPRFGDHSQRTYIRRTLSAIVRAPSLFEVATKGDLEEKAIQLTQVLQRARLTQCYDPRDRIYGFLGIMSAMFGADFIEPNYECSVADTYTDFVVRLINTTGSLSVLSQAESICNATPGLPTFVPDWSSRFQQHDAFSRLNTYSQYHAAGKKPVGNTIYTPSQNSRTRLRCRGAIFGRVELTGDCTRSVFGSPEGKALASMIESWRKLYQGEDELFVRLITADRLGYAMSLVECLKTLQHSPASDESPNEARDAIGNATSARRFFITDLGQLGLGPRDTRVGDLLSVISGGRVPFVLRASPIQKGIHPFSFVGDCYVQGIMYGELLKGLDPPRFQLISLE